MGKLKNWLSKIGRYAVIIVVLLTLVSLMRNISRIKKAGERVDEARGEVVKLEEENKELEEKLGVLQSEVYIEKQIRDGLGLAKEGEYIVVLPEDDVLRSLAPRLPEQEEILPPPNWQKWLNLFI